MKKLNNFLYKSYRLVTGSIAFYPTLIALGFFIFSLIVMLLEYEPFMMDLKENISFILVKSKADARLVLGTLVGSVISLMVFSFSMVMIVLNRASATLSPRVIPGLITDKSNQVVLGYYLGSIVYSLILIVNIQSNGTERTPDFGILMAMIFGITCLAFFMYFIHTISQSIQVDNILKRIQLSTEREMESLSLDEDEKDIPTPDSSNWHTLNTPKSGYLKRVKINELVKLCHKHTLRIKLKEPIGEFIVKNYPYLDIDSLPENELLEEIHECFIFYPEERLDDHYLFGFKQISEIAVKALSPGINDPGTAVKAINLLSILFTKKIEMKDKYYITDHEDSPRLFFAEITLESLLYYTFTSIREYGKTDALVMLSLLESLKNLLFAEQSKNYHKTIIAYTQSMICSCQENIRNDFDKNMINKVIVEINNTLPENQRVSSI